MVKIELEYSIQSGETFLLKGRVRNVGRAAAPTLLCELDADDLAFHFASRLRLKQFPTVPLPLCIAQAIQSAANMKPGSQSDLRKTLERACIKLFVGGGERLDFVLWRMYEELEDEVGMLPAWGRATMTPWRLGQRMLERAATVWPSSALLEMPSATSSVDDVGYCRAADLPKSLRPLFAQQHCLAPQPVIDGVPDAFFASDVARFLLSLGRDNALVRSHFDDEPTFGGPGSSWPDLGIAVRKLHELGLADGDLGFSYWRDVTKLLLSANSSRKRVESLSGSSSYGPLPRKLQVRRGAQGAGHEFTAILVLHD
ncbi:Uncharacterised protein [Xylophilus ampelinus]|nr:Uncharacterised protein [Xylophilus ampelinus]